MIALGSALAPAAEPAALSPDEMAVMDWLQVALADLSERSGVRVDYLAVESIRYFHTDEIAVHWTLQSRGQCVISQPSIAEGVKALKAKLAEAATTEAAQP